MSSSALTAAEGLATELRVPDFFIVGEPKSGTTALYEILRQHPQIYMPDLKEPLFLASDLPVRFERPTTRHRPKTLEDYLSLFAAAAPQQRAGEASALYLRSHEAAANIAKLQPHARIVAIFREPASFLRSLHLQLLQNHTETQKDLRKALSLEHARRRGERIPRSCARPEALLYSEWVRYVEHLCRYHAAFPREQVQVLIYDDFRADNEQTARSVLRFLGVDDAVAIQAKEVNQTVRLRSRHLDTIARDISVGNRNSLSRVAKAGVKALTTRRVRRTAVRMARRKLIVGRPDPADEELMRELRDRCKAEVVALSEYLGRDLVRLWGYDGIN